MSPRAFVTALLLAAPPAAAASGVHIAPPEKAELPPGTAAVAIPIEVYEHQILARVRVNGEGPYWFIVDTGWTRSAVDRSHAAAMHVAQTGESQGIGAGGNVTAGSASEAVRFDFGQGLVITAKGATIADFSGNATLFGRPYQGVIGHNILGRYVVEIDYERHRLVLHDPGRYRYGGRGAVLAATFWNGYDPQVPAELDLPGRAPVPTVLTLDTGAGGLTVASPLVDSFVAAGAKAKVVDSPLDGMGGKAAFVMGRLAAIRVGPYKLDRPWAALSRMTEGSFADASIGLNGGGEVLSRFRVIIDYTRSQVILEPNGHFADPFPWDASGMILTVGGEDRRTYTIYRLIPGSPAVEAGLEQGDVLVAVDGRAARERTLAEIRTILQQAGTAHRLSVRRDGKVFTVELKLRALI